MENTRFCSYQVCLDLQHRTTMLMILSSLELWTRFRHEGVICSGESSLYTLIIILYVTEKHKNIILTTSEMDRASNTSRF